MKVCDIDRNEIQSELISDLLLGEVYSGCLGESDEVYYFLCADGPSIIELRSGSIFGPNITYSKHREIYRCIHHPNARLVV